MYLWAQPRAAESWSICKKRLFRSALPSEQTRPNPRSPPVRSGAAAVPGPMPALHFPHATGGIGFSYDSAQFPVRYTTLMQAVCLSFPGPYAGGQPAGVRSVEQGRYLAGGKTGGMRQIHGHTADQLPQQRGRPGRRLFLGCGNG